MPLSPRSFREPVTGERDDNDVEGIVPSAPVSHGIGQRFHHLVELEERPWPSVNEHQRQGVWVGRRPMDEVHVQAVDPGHEVRERVETPLLLTPIELVAPIRHQLLEVLDIGAVIPPDAFELVRKPGPGQPSLQVAQHRVRHFDGERSHLAVGRRLGLRGGHRLRRHQGHDGR